MQSWSGYEELPIVYEDGEVGRVQSNTVEVRGMTYTALPGYMPYAPKPKQEAVALHPLPEAKLRISWWGRFCHRVKKLWRR